MDPEDVVVGGMVRVEAVGMGAPGFVSSDRSTVLFTPNLPWREEPLGAEMAQRLNVPVVVENDANCAAGPRPGSARRAGRSTWSL